MIKDALKLMMNGTEDEVIDFIDSDPHNKLFQHRYYNQHTRTIDGGDDTFVVKDLNIFKG